MQLACRIILTLLWFVTAPVIFAVMFVIDVADGSSSRDAIKENCWALKATFMDTWD